MATIAALAITLLGSWGICGMSQLPNPSLAWKNVAVGLKGTIVYGLFVDSRGVAWVGSARGAYFYDGVSLRAVGGKNMSGTQVYAFAERNGMLYMGTSNGLMVYDRRKGTVAYPSVVTPREIRCLMMLGDCLYMGSLDGLFCWDMGKGGEPKNVSAGLPNSSVYALLCDSRGIVYAGTLRGLARWNSLKKSFDCVECDAAGSQSRPFVNCLAETADGQSILVGGNEALWCYSPKWDTWNRVEAIAGENVKCLAQTRKGHLFVGTENGVYDIGAGYVRHYRHDFCVDGSLADNEIWTLMCDEQENVWAGTGRGFSVAVNSGNIHTWRLGNLSSSGEAIDVLAISRDKTDCLWIGGMNGVVSISAKGDALWHHNDGRKGCLSHNHVRAIRKDSKGDLWFCTDGGINRYDYVSGHFDVFHLKKESGLPVSDWVYDLAEDPNGHLYVGTYMDGLRWISRKDLISDSGAVPSKMGGNKKSHVCGLVCDGSGNIWSIAFSDNSLIKREPSGRQTRYDIFRLTGQYPAKICLDKKGRVWVGFQGGCAVFGAKGHLATVSFPQTHGSEEVLAMAPVGGDVWVSTQSNVWRIDGKALKADILSLPYNVYTAIYEDSSSGKVLLGATDEIVEVNLFGLGERVKHRNSYILFAALHKDNAPFTVMEPQGEPISLAYGGGLTVVIGATDYSPEVHRSYIYKIADDSLDTAGGWISLPEGANEIALTEMTMGKHMLLIKPVGSPLPPMAVPLEVSRPWALSWLAIAVYTFMVMGLAFGIYRMTRLRALRRQHEAERKKALDDAEKKLMFLSDISHDLKTPLSMIMGPISLMKEKEENAHDRKTLEMVYDNAVKLNNMIHRTLELRQIKDQDESLLILSSVEVVQFCSAIFDTFRENNPQKKFIFHSSIAQAVVEVDVVKLESVVTNLLSNACKYSPDGATISCGIGGRDSSVEIIVSDDGAGIAQADLSLVFHRMFRSASAPTCEGTGIGLYLVKKYVELMKGTVEMHSEQNQGTSFTITLPRSTTHAAETSTTDAVAADSGKPKVLVVEDNRQIADFIAEVLAGEFVCFQAENGRAGLSLAASMSPDLVVLDEMMPVMSGLQMAAQMKKNPRLALIPIIMLTAKVDNLTETESVRLGVDVFMGKPFEPTMLLGRIKMLLQSRANISQNVRIKEMTEAKPVEAESVAERLMAKIAQAVEDNVTDCDLNVASLCEKTGISNKQLYRLIKKYLGVSPLEYIKRVRLQKAAMLLAQKRFTISEVAYMVGFQTPSYFAKCFQKEYGVLPSQYEEKKEN